MLVRVVPVRMAYFVEHLPVDVVQACSAAKKHAERRGKLLSPHRSELMPFQRRHALTGLGLAAVANGWGSGEQDLFARHQIRKALVSTAHIPGR